MIKQFATNATTVPENSKIPGIQNQQIVNHYFEKYTRSVIITIRSMDIRLLKWHLLILE